MAKFNVEKARQAGHSEQAIQAYLKKHPELAPIDAKESPEQVDVKKESTGFKVPEPIKKIGELLTTPQRGLRGVGVFAQKALEGTAAGTQNMLDPAGTMTKVMMNTPEALQRASAAVKPDYVPQQGENIGAAIGEGVGSLPLMAASGGVAGIGAKALPLITKGKLAYNIITSAAATGVPNALEQVASKGKFDPGELAFAAGFGGAIPMVKPAFAVIKKAATKVLPSLLEATSGVPQAATIRKIKDPKSLFNVQGTEEMIEKKVISAQEAVKTARNKIGEVRNKILEKLGILEDGSEAALLERVAAGEPPPVKFSDIVEKLNQVRKNVKMPAKVKIKTLLDVRANLKAHMNSIKLGQQVRPISEKFQKDLTETYNLANSMLDKIPQAKRLRVVDKAYSEAIVVYSELQKNLATTGQAEDFLERLFAGKKLGDMKGSIKQSLKYMSRVEKMSGMKIIEPLEKEFTVQAFKRILPKKGLGTFISLAGTATLAAANPALGAAAATVLSPKLAGLGMQAAQGFAKGAGSSAGQGLMRQAVLAKLRESHKKGRK